MRRPGSEPSLEERIDESIRRLRIWDARVRDQAIGELIRCGDAAVPALCGVLETESEVARTAACQALRALRDTRSVRWLCRAALDPSELVSQAAVGALGALRSREAVYTLCQLVNQGGETGLRAAEALAKIGDPSATPAVLHLMRQWVFGTRESLITVLGQLGDPRATLPLCEMLDNGSHAEQVAAAKALGEIGDQRAVTPLCQVLRYPLHAEIRQARREAVVKIGARDAAPLARLLAYDDSTPEIAEQALQELGASAAPEVAAMLRSPSAAARRRAARLLGTARTPEQAPNLIQALGDPMAEVRQEAALALGLLAAPGTEPALRAVQGNPKERAQVRACAGVALAEHGEGSAEVIVWLVEALELDRPVRQRAARALLRIAQTEPSVALRAAVKKLRSLSRAWTLPREEKAIYREALAQVEAVTANRRDLPIPSSRTRDGSHDLPRPAEPPRESDDLPRPGS